MKDALKKRTDGRFIGRGSVENELNELWGNTSKPSNSSQMNSKIGKINEASQDEENLVDEKIKVTATADVGAVEAIKGKGENVSKKKNEKRKKRNNFRSKNN